MAENDHLTPPRRQLFWMRKPFPGKSRHLGNYPGPPRGISREMREITREILPVEFPGGFSGYLAAQPGNAHGNSLPAQPKSREIDRWISGKRISREIHGGRPGKSTGDALRGKRISRETHFPGNPPRNTTMASAAVFPGGGILRSAFAGPSPEQRDISNRTCALCVAGARFR